MHPNAELHQFVRGAVGILCGYRRLHSDSALHGIDRAGEVGNDAIAGNIEDAATMRRDQSVDDGAARFQSGQRADVVTRHQPAVASDVGGEDRGQFALYRLDGHARLLPIRV